MSNDNGTTLELIGAPTDVGASVRGAGMGPDALRVAGLPEALARQGFTVIDRGNLAGPATPWTAPANGLRHLDEVIAWNRSVYAAVDTALGTGHVPLMMGGDHCLAIGSISAVAWHVRKRGKKLRVLWLDAHSDVNTETTSPSGNLHGMPVSCLLGHGPRRSPAGAASARRWSTMPSASSASAASTRTRRTPSAHSACMCSTCATSTSTACAPP